MITAHQYQLRPNQEQASQFDDWLSLLRMQYNWTRAERFNWFESNRSPVNSCSLVSCSIAPIVKQPDYYWQKKELLNTKKLFPEYAGIHSQVLLNCIERVKKALERYIKADSSGKHSGKLRFKGRGRNHSFTYTQMKQDCIKGNRITLPKIGDVKIILDRPIPDGFKIKTATIVFAADGYYVTLTWQDEAVPVISRDFYPEKLVGIDMGLNEVLNTSEADTGLIPQFARKAGQVKKRLNKSVYRKKKGSNRRGETVKRWSRHHQKVARQGKDFHYKTAQPLLDRYDLIGFEDLNVKGWAKTRFAKSILDAGWSEFLAIVACNAQSAGKMTIAVHLNGTTQNCSSCGTRIPKTMTNRWHSCHLCGLELDGDVNAAINVKNFAVGGRVIKASLCVSYVDAGLAQKSTLYSSTS
ncbi:RNA-guided endonuclease InsQ/TnpB family protein [Microcoleus sp.]|uniref:RNA-guided endonuclease InsQ/TnpB family protein n=1 Tax=Microcoleus sp. TaxID=44472 RepID=UPI00403E97DD